MTRSKRRYLLAPCPDCKGAGGFASGASIDGPGEDSECRRCHGTGKVRKLNTEKEHP